MATQASSPISNQVGFIRQAQLVPAIVPISAATLWRWVKRGTFPAPTKIGPGTTAWHSEDVAAWIAAQKPATDQSVQGAAK